MAILDETWVCVGDINFPGRVIPNRSTFPTAELRQAAIGKGVARARKAGVDLADEAAVATFTDAEIADLEREMRTLIDCGSLLSPTAALSRDEAVDQLAARDAEIARLREQLAAQGLPPSLAGKPTTTGGEG